jgi:rhamnulokinase
MAKTMRLAAVDLGAESGRVVVGAFTGDRLTVEAVHRFTNRPVEIAGTLHWDAVRLFADVLDGVRAAGRVSSVGIDTWGVDFGLIDRNGRLVGNPVHYRDRRTEGMVERAFRALPRQEIYARTGIQFIPINTLYQLLALATSSDPQLAMAERLLMMPALLGFWVTGVQADEFTDATTTQCFDPRAGAWANDLLERLGIPTRIFGEVVQPGTEIGKPRAELDLDVDRVIAPGTHDTASAVAAVPFESPHNAAYISSGTWSLVGMETTKPVIDDRALEANLTNEGGVSGTFRLLKNVMGLWLLQECRRSWAAGGTDLSYEELLRQAEAATPFAALVDPDDESLLRPGDMPTRIVQLAAKSGRSLPREPGAIARCILESLAMKYWRTILQLEQVTGSRIHTIHVVGGGANNELLCQMTADACGRAVIAGPSEATAIGNLLVQAIALGVVANLDQGRQLVGKSFQPKTYEPRMAAEWAAMRQPA